MAAARAIELRGLTRAFGERTALADVSVELEAGATLVVFGPNGAGKSTLLRVLATLLGRRAATRSCSAPSSRGEGTRCAGESASSATRRCSTAT